MPQGQLYINNKDAYTEWGISMDGKALSALMTPSGMKENLKIESRLENGRRVISNNAKVNSRNLNLTINLCARTEAEFFRRYASFCDELKTGFLDVRTSFQSNVVYHLEYNDCTQFTQFMRGIAKFTLKCTENNPEDRAI